MIYSKNCPTCNKEISYSDGKALKRSIQNNCNCKRCSAIKKGPRDQETKKKISQTLTGRTIPRDIVEKITKTLKIKFNTPEYKQKFSEMHKGENNGMYGKQHSEEIKNKISDITKEKMNSPEMKEKMRKIQTSQEYREKLSAALMGRKHTQESKLKMKGPRICLQGENNPNFGKCRKHTDEDKRKMREAVVRRVQKYGIISRNFNPDACKIIDEYGQKNGYNFQHAMNGGEYSCIGYLVDGYDKEKNVVIEIDEPYHNKLSQKEKDIKRQKRIEEHLQCKFIRLPFNKDEMVIESNIKF
jgi:hypothetical protein